MELPIFEEPEGIMFEGQTAEDNVDVQEPESQEPEPVEEEKLDIDQICSQINDHQGQFDPFIFIENYTETYSTDIIVQALKNVLEKMNMAAGVDPIIMGKFDFGNMGNG